MKTGMMWFDGDSKKPLGVKIREAAAYYRTKYGRDANYCEVNTNAFTDVTAMDDDRIIFAADDDRIIVAARRNILPGHLWIGVEE